MTLEVTKRLELDASPERVWHAITDPDELARWFPDQEADFALEPGYTGAFVWQQYGRYAVRIEKAEPHHTLVWSWARKANTPFDDAPTTRVEWKLSPRPGGGTVLELRESGFEDAAARQDNDGGWDQELGELVALLQRQPVLA